MENNAVILEELLWGLGILMDFISTLFIYMLVMGAKLRYSPLKTIFLSICIILAETLLIYPLEIREIFTLIVCAPSVFLLAGSKKKWLSLFFPTLIIMSVIQTLIISLLNLSAAWEDKPIFSLIVGVIAVLILAVAYYLVRPYQNIDSDYSIVQIIFLNLTSVCLSLLLGEVQAFLSIGRREYLSAAGELIHNAMLATCIALCILVFYLSIIKRRLDDAKRSAEENEFLLRMQSEQMDIVIKSEEKLHAFKHDLIAHLNALSAFADDGDVSKVRDYCDSLLADTTSFVRVAYTGNPALDGVLNQLKGIAQERGVELDIKMTVPKEKKISDYDLCILISNIIKNAIEANNAGGKVDIKSWPFNENLCIISSNTTTHPLEYKKGMLLSTKRNYQESGYGMRNIQAVVDKYDGDFQIKMDGNLVKVEALV